MSILSLEEKIDCLKNLLADPDDWISYSLLVLNNESEALKLAGSSLNSFGDGNEGLNSPLTNGAGDGSH